MALRFRCEHCGKRLQVDTAPGAPVLCPYCRHTLAVPADARPYTGGAAAAHEAPPEDALDPTEHGLAVAVATYVPTWGTSVVLHLAVILVALMGTWAAVTPPNDPEYDARVVQPPRPNVVPTERPERSRTTREEVSHEYSSFVFKPTTNPVPGVTPFKGRPIEIIGTQGGDRGAPDGGFPGFGQNRGGPHTDGWFPPFFNKRRIVFVIDRSGSMTDSIMFVKMELKRAIRCLKPNQEFHVIFYSTGPAVEMPAGRLVPAIERNKNVSFEFIDNIFPTGGTDPSEALKAAFRANPEVIHLLTDGEFKKDIVDLIDKLNTRKTQVNTYCFIYRSGEWLCQEIARRNEGQYKFIGEDSLDTAGR